MINISLLMNWRSCRFYQADTQRQQEWAAMVQQVHELMANGTPAEDPAGRSASRAAGC